MLMQSGGGLDLVTDIFETIITLIITVLLDFGANFLWSVLITIFNGGISAIESFGAPLTMVILFVILTVSWVLSQ